MLRSFRACVSSTPQFTRTLLPPTSLLFFMALVITSGCSAVNSSALSFIICTDISYVLLASR